jgi:hypothetical protein
MTAKKIRSDLDIDSREDTKPLTPLEGIKENQNSNVMLSSEICSRVWSLVNRLDRLPPSKDNEDPERPIIGLLDEIGLSQENEKRVLLILQAGVKALEDLL